jgi:cytochrome c
MDMLLKTSRLTPFAAAALFASLASGAALAQPAADAASVASVAKGKRLFMRCAACHDTADNGAPRTGPHLKGLVGRPMGGVADYKYSPGLKAKGQVWDEAQLNAWLTRPTAVVPGTTMAFIGMPDAAERKALIDYLRTVK